MPEAKTPKSKNQEAPPTSNKTKNFLELNKLKLQKLSKENEIRRKDLSPRYTPKITSPLKSARRPDLGTQKLSTLATIRMPAGGAENRKSFPITARVDTGMSRKHYKRKERVPTPRPEKRNQCVQACNTGDESFLKNAKLLEPSAHILAAIKEDRKKGGGQLKAKFVPKMRTFAKHEANEKIHIENLKEFLETGAISRRRKTQEKRREELQKKLDRYGIMTSSYSDPSSLFKTRPKTQHDIKSSKSSKVNPPDIYTHKSNLAKEAGDSRNRQEDPQKLVVVYQRK